MDVLVQSVRTWWSTASRGGPAAARRNAVPVGFLLPTPQAPLAHDVAVREADDFVPSSRWRAGLPEAGRTAP
ncbi:hypothetical protein [Cellulomonas sp. NS3]|uniref:hypothetical protein n=1 Tax=Cellulomonas sp. NS3 TaxID=2973977 RepID=UPI00216341B8|nr:hypothetical protein [Cellulomonas sp. NS3]